MKTAFKITDRKTSQFRSAFTLIEMIGVLTVIAILAAFLVPALIRQMDRIAGEQETAAMQSFGDAFQRSVQRNRSIPAFTNMAAAIATELGVDVTNVTINPRQRPRIFLVDPNFTINGGGLPYTQTVAGSTNLPVSPRLMILSSIGRPLPSIVSSSLSAADFNTIWNTADGTVPSVTDFTSPPWTGTGEDLKIQRINLSSLFVRLLLSTFASDGPPFYTIDSTNFATAITINSSTPVQGIFIQNSVLTLYHWYTNTDARQILLRDESFIYNNNSWQASLSGGLLIAGLDVVTVVNNFLSARPNGRAQFGANQQPRIVSNMIVYMNAYSDWADSGWNAGQQTALKNTIQPNMLNAVQGQYLKGGATDYSPTNTPCP